jgi:hypothetical protein
MLECVKPSCREIRGAEINYCKWYTLRGGTGGAIGITISDWFIDLFSVSDNSL